MDIEGSRSATVNTQEKAITDEMVEERIKELKPHHPVFAAILEKVHEMNLKEVVNALDGS